MVKANNMCVYKYGRGAKNGQQCNRKCIGDYCGKHKSIKGNSISKDQKDEVPVEDIEVFDEDEVEEDQETVASEISIQVQKPKPRVSKKDDDILITKYFVHDCIREFFRDHHEMNELFGKKPSSSSSSSNLTSILGMAGISLIPLLMRNLSNLGIDGIHKQGITGEVRDANRSSSETERETRNSYGKFELPEDAKEIFSPQSTQDRDQSASERILENIKRNTKA